MRGRKNDNPQAVGFTSVLAQAGHLLHGVTMAQSKRRKAKRVSFNQGMRSLVGVNTLRKVTLTGSRKRVIFPPFDVNHNQLRDSLSLQGQGRISYPSRSYANGNVRMRLEIGFWRQFSE